MLKGCDIRVFLWRARIANTSPILHHVTSDEAVYLNEATLSCIGEAFAKMFIACWRAGDTQLSCVEHFVRPTCGGNIAGVSAFSVSEYRVIRRKAVINCGTMLAGKIFFAPC